MTGTVRDLLATEKARRRWVGLDRSCRLVDIGFIISAATAVFTHSDVKLVALMWAAVNLSMIRVTLMKRLLDRL